MPTLCRQRRQNRRGLGCIDNSGRAGCSIVDQERIVIGSAGDCDKFQGHGGRCFQAGLNSIGSSWRGWVNRIRKIAA